MPRDFAHRIDLVNGSAPFKLSQQGLWGFTKVPYRGLRKNTVRTLTLFALSNLYLARVWMLLVWRTPPRSDLFVAPLRRRWIVVALFPKASRKA